MRPIDWSALVLDGSGEHRRYACRFLSTWARRWPPTGAWAAARSGASAVRGGAPAVEGVVVFHYLAGREPGGDRTGGPHRLRHSAATAMLRAGASLEEVARVLRPRSTQVTALYAKVDFVALSAVRRSGRRICAATVS